MKYMVLIQPSASDLDELRKTPAYEVLQRDQTAHVVYDKKTGITAYAAFEAYQLPLIKCSWLFLRKQW